jgi:hypothetical protein
MIQKNLLEYLLKINNKYNELVLHHLIVLPMLVLVGILISIFQDLFAFFIYSIITVLLIAPSYLIINKIRTCPECKSWKHSVFCSRQDNFKVTYYCKRCEKEWQK